MRYAFLISGDLLTGESGSRRQGLIRGSKPNFALAKHPVRVWLVAHLGDFCAGVVRGDGRASEMVAEAVG